ncbi:uncharacterized protein LOC110977175 [Acanthaster planci]|uniref:Uncharacterized protein LOC110977175 n=1 Tax=Acanthaster planci TaxID=133434 RepID=A0A8B7Y0R2_ACAPL|nr:uncharacterized protein LOC110977175 [Acanthaster planci]
MSSLQCAVTGILLVSVLDRVNGRPARLLLPANDSPSPEDCQAPDEYWDTEKGDCAICVQCGPGHGSTAVECGYGRGEKGTCNACIAGETYQDEVTAGQCKPCTPCDENAIVKSNCTTNQNRVCGPCKPGYGSHSGHEGLCSLCPDFNDAEKPPECDGTSTPLPIIQASPSTVTLISNTNQENVGSTQNVAMETNLDTTFSFTRLSNGTTAKQGTSSLGIGLGIGLGVGLSVILIILLVYCYKICQQCRQPSGPSKPDVVGASQEEKDKLTGDQSGTDHDNTEASGGGDTEAERVTDIDEGAIYSASKQEGSVRLELNAPDQTLPNGALPIDTDNPSSGRPTLEDVQNAQNTKEPGHSSKNGDVTVTPSSSCRHDSTDGNVSPRIMLPTIEESPNGQSASDRPALNRQNSNKFQQILDTFSSKITSHCRPEFKRSISEPADEKKRQDIQQTVSGKQIVLPLTVRKKCIKNDKDRKQKEFDKNFEKACSLGREMKWEDLSSTVRKEVNQMLTEDKKALSSYKDLGEVFGVNRNSQLKVCTSADDIFEVLATDKVPPNMEVILQKLLEIKRCDVVRKVVDNILKQKSS